MADAPGAAVRTSGRVRAPYSRHAGNSSPQRVSTSERALWHPELLYLSDRFEPRVVRSPLTAASAALPSSVSLIYFFSSGGASSGSGVRSSSSKVSSFVSSISSQLLSCLCLPRCHVCACAFPRAVSFDFAVSR